jgi:hypothetical protein
LAAFKNIVMILVKYGFDDLVDHLNIPGTKFMRKTSPIDKPMDTSKESGMPAKSWGRPLSSLGSWSVFGLTWCRHR